MTWTIVRDAERYPGCDVGMPNRFVLSGDITREQAEEVAQRLSNYYAGCDELYSIVED